VDDVQLLPSTPSTVQVGAKMVSHVPQVCWWLSSACAAISLSGEVISAANPVTFVDKTIAADSVKLNRRLNFFKFILWIFWVIKMGIYSIKNLAFGGNLRLIYTYLKKKQIKIVATAESRKANCNIHFFMVR
jgi:hypothetical protein